VGGRQVTGLSTGRGQLVRQPRLPNQVTATSGALTVYHHGVRDHRSFTLVEAGRVSNSGGDTLGLPVYGIPSWPCRADHAAGRSVPSKWAESVPPGGELRGTIVFGGTLGTGRDSVSLSFTHVFGPAARAA